MLLLIPAVSITELSAQVVESFFIAMVLTQICLAYKKVRYKFVVITL
jgi:hypothetical protein